MKKICINIATYKRYDYLLNLLGNIQANLSDKFDIRVLIVSPVYDKQFENLNKFTFPTQLIFGEESWWWTKCTNVGMQHFLDSEDDYLLLLNDDSVISSDFISKLLLKAEENPHAIIGSMTITLEEPARISFCGSMSISKTLRRHKNYLPKFTPLANLPSDMKANLLPTYTLNGRGTIISRENLLKVGLLDEKLVQYGSDDDFCLRAWTQGIPVYIYTDSLLYNHTNMTSVGAAFKKDGLSKFVQSFFNDYSVNSIRKTYYFNRKRLTLIHTLFIVLFSVLGTFKAYFFNYRNYQK